MNAGDKTRSSSASRKQVVTDDAPGEQMLGRAVSVPTRVAQTPPECTVGERQRTDADVAEFPVTLTVTSSEV